MTQICQSYCQQIQEALKGFKPEIALILGSGLGTLADKIQNPIIVKYSDIKGFPQSTVQGHKGQFVCGLLNGKKVICMQGRIHLYEGHKPQDICQILKTFKLLGVQKLVVTNAAGSLNPKIKAGSIMMITDHINLSFTNPLIGPNDETFGPRFPDMSNAYDKDLQLLASNIANEENINIEKGVYLMVSGPNFETSAEVRTFGLLGADAVGMSTVPEVISASYCGIKTIGFSVITNMGTGLQTATQSHDETLAMAKKATSNLAVLLDKLFERI